MQSVPDFSQHGYQIEKELGANRAGGRVTYLATELDSQRLAVLKQFQFARTSASWVDYDALKQEIQILKDLKHPGIPRYLGVFQSEDGFCMVQEYKQASSLAELRSFSPDEVRQIAIAALEILVYLQNRIPAVIHRDIKPANILVDEDTKVYIVDFGFARVGDGEVGVSSVVKGTLGFMPPEQLFNRQLTEASDLYGLGMTIICLLTNTPADEVGSLVDISYRVDFKNLKSNISPRWIKWLEKMVEPRVDKRFPNAAAALAAIPEHSLRQPEVCFSQADINLVARDRGELLTQTVTLSNTVPETQLEGCWEVAPHLNDPPMAANGHSWIHFSPATFHSNQVTTKIQVDTRQLMTGKRYSRQLVLRTNAHPSLYSVTLNVQTAPLPIRTKGGSYGLVAMLLGCCWITAWLFAAMLPAQMLEPSAAPALALVVCCGLGIGIQLAAWILVEAGMRFGSKSVAMTGFAVMLSTLLSWLAISVVPVDSFVLVSTAGIGLFGGSIVGIATGMVAETLYRRGFKEPFAVLLPTATAIFSVLLGASRGLALLNHWLLIGLISTGAAVAAMLTYLPIQRAQAIAAYRSAERRLIRP
ncbi:MAG: serine/threonine protein kinase [Leptolyngbya sp. SIO4C1]|nr:serine/threonine protein kinase [Leptolyngbya sp. SIO4C1]